MHKFLDLAFYTYTFAARFANKIYAQMSYKL